MRRALWFMLALMAVPVSACAEPAEPSAPASASASARQVVPPEDFCSSVDYAMVAGRLEGQLVPGGPSSERIDDFKLICRHSTYAGSKHGNVAIDVTIIRFDSPGLAEAEARGRAAQASPAPTGPDYSYIASDGKVIAGAQRGSYLAEVRLIPIGHTGDAMLPGLAKEFLDKVTASLTP